MWSRPLAPCRLRSFIAFDVHCQRPASAGRPVGHVEPHRPLLRWHVGGRYACGVRDGDDAPRGHHRPRHGERPLAVAGLLFAPTRARRAGHSAELGLPSACVRGARVAERIGRVDWAEFRPFKEVEAVRTIVAMPTAARDEPRRCAQAARSLVDGGTPGRGLRAT